MIHRSYSMLPASLVLALLVLIPTTQAAGLTCTGMVVPSLGDGNNTAGFIPAGPKLLSVGGDYSTDYNYIVNSGSDKLQLWSYPGVGISSAYYRDVNVALSGTGVGTYSAAATANAAKPECMKHFAPFQFTTGGPTADGTYITDGVTLKTVLGDVTDATCYFNHLFEVKWEDFRNSTLANCGFTASDNSTASLPDGGIYKQYRGRVHVQWGDAATWQGAALRTAMSTWYDVTIQVQSEVTKVSNMTNSTEIPYKSDFQVEGVTYTKGNDGRVTTDIKFHLTTNFPYYPEFSFLGNTIVPSDILRHVDQDVSHTTPAYQKYGDLVLGSTAAGANFPQSDADPTASGWSFAYTTATTDGKHTSGGALCNTVGQECYMEGTVSYSWIPKDTVAGSCSLASTSAYQFDFYLGCNKAYNGTLTSSCDQPMRSALNFANFGSFNLQGNVDFCKAAATDFPITWTTRFDVETQTRTIGQAIGANGVFTTNKQLAAVAIKEYRVARNGMVGYWNLWTGGLTAATADVVGGSVGKTTTGTNVDFRHNIVGALSNKQWTIQTWFTPNINMQDAKPATDLAGGDAHPYMIYLPADKDQLLSFTITAIIRMFADSQQTFTRRRRLLYRDVPVVSSAAVNDIELETKPVSIKVPANIQVSKDGSVTVVNSTQTLSTGAIAGIAAMGAVVAAAAIGLAVLLVKRHQKKAATRVDSEAAMVQKGSTEALAQPAPYWTAK